MSLDLVKVHFSNYLKFTTFIVDFYYPAPLIHSLALPYDYHPSKFHYRLELAMLFKRNHGVHNVRISEKNSREHLKLRNERTTLFITNNTHTIKNIITYNKPIHETPSNYLYVAVEKWFADV